MLSPRHLLLALDQLTPLCLLSRGTYLRFITTSYCSHQSLQTTQKHTENAKGFSVGGFFLVSILAPKIPLLILCSASWCATALLENPYPGSVRLGRVLFLAPPNVCSYKNIAHPIL